MLRKCINRKSSPGFPWADLSNNNGALLDSYESLVAESIMERLEGLYNMDLSACYTAKQLVEQGLVDPIRLFVKREPHSRSKIEEGRLRLIFSVSIVDNAIALLLCSLQNNTEILYNSDLPVKAGLGFHDDGVKKILNYVSTQIPNPVETDVSGWDWCFQEDDFNFDCQRRIELCGAQGTVYEKIIRAHFKVMSLKCMLLSDGSILQQVLPGIMPSGWYNTSSTNSNVRVHDHYCVALSQGLRPAIMAMGDDSVETQCREPAIEYAKRGRKVKDFKTVTTDGFEFCSHYFSGGKAVPLNIEKQLFNLLSLTPTTQAELDQHLDDFQWLHRSNPELDSLLLLIKNVGWSEQFKVLQSNFGSFSLRSQNSKSANQNAKRLHGLHPRLEKDEQSSLSLLHPIQMTRKTKSRKRAVVAQRPKQTQQAPSMTSIANQVSKMVLKQLNPSLQNRGNNTTLGNLGMMAGNGISKIFGLGAYKMKRNSLYDSQTGSQVPFMHSTDETVVFRHREYLGDLTSSVGFTPQTFSLNPGLETTFPYLSNIASNFQEYKFRGLIFEYKSTSSTVVTGANTAMGTVSMVAQYRSDAPPLTSKLSLLNEMWSAEGRPSDTFIMPVECDPRENPVSIQYVRTGALPPNQDVKLYDLAKVTIATQGQQTAGTIIGELWISYEVELLKPILGSGSNNMNDDAARYSRIGATNAAPIGFPGVTFYDTIGLVLTNNSISMPPGKYGTYAINITWTATAVVAVAPLVSSFFGTLTNASYTPNNGSTTDKLTYNAIWTLNTDTLDDVPSLVFGAAGTIPLAAVTIVVAEIASGFV